MMNSIRHILAALTVWVGLCGVAEAYLLKNSFFDEPIDFEDGVGWESFAPPGQSDPVGQHDWASGAPGVGGQYGVVGDGNFGLAFQTWLCTGGGFYQDVPVIPGLPYTFQIQSHSGCNSPGGNNWPVESVIMINFDWYDGDPSQGGTLIVGHTNILNTTDGGCDEAAFDNYVLPGNWDNWAFTHTSPVDAAVLRLVVAWDGGGHTQSGGSEAIRWDNALLTTTLAPTNLALEATDDMLAVSFNAQTTVTYRAQRSLDMQAWSPVTALAVKGNDAIQTVYDYPVWPAASWRVASQQFRGLLNGDFNSTNVSGGPLHWNTWTLGEPGNGWTNLEKPTAIDSSNPGHPDYRPALIGVYDQTLQMSIGGFSPGGGGVYQLVPATPGHSYTLSVEAGAQDWWWPTCEMRLIFLDAAERELGLVTVATSDAIDGFDIGLPYQPFSLTATAPPGTELLKVEFANPVGTGTCWFDNAVLTDNDGPASIPDPLPYEVALAQVASDLITFDGQRGVFYQLEYSEDGGIMWQSTTLPVVRGDGTRMRVFDPEGPSLTRSYRLVPTPLTTP